MKRIEGQDVIFDLGKAEARCPKREQSRLEQFTMGERVRVVLPEGGSRRKGSAGDRVARGAGAGAALVRDGSAGNLRQHRLIRAVAREAGERTKIAVSEPRQGCRSAWAPAWV